MLLSVIEMNVRELSVDPVGLASEQEGRVRHCKPYCEGGSGGSGRDQLEMRMGDVRILIDAGVFICLKGRCGRLRPLFSHRLDKRTRDRTGHRLRATGERESRRGRGALGWR